MKKLLLITTIFSISIWANTTTISAITNYNYATNPAVWKDVAKGRLPKKTVGRVNIKTPPLAFSYPYENIFFQNARFVVCIKSCEIEQPLKFSQDKNGNYSIKSSIIINGKPDNAFLASNVYYWLTKLFDHFESLGHVPTKQLKVIVQRDTFDFMTGVKAKDNAFFMNMDWSLSFLPRTKRGRIISKIVPELLPSSTDPMVIMHEATHSVFEDLVGSTTMNPEIAGLHEAFADYFPASILNNPILGPFMSRGNAIRRLDTLNQYSDNMEAHDLGNVIGPALWMFRTHFDDKLAFDKAVYKTAQYISLDLYADSKNIVSAFKNAIEQTDGLIGPMSDPETIEKEWAKINILYTPLNISKKLITNLLNRKPTHYYTIISSMKIPPKITNEFGIKTQKIQIKFLDIYENWIRISYHQDKFIGETPLWVRFNAEKGAIDAAINQSGQIVQTDDLYLLKAIKSIQESIAQALSFEKNVKSAKEILYEKTLTSLITKPKEITHTQSSRILNGKLIPIWVHEAKLKSSFWTKILPDSLEKQLTAMTNIKVVTADVEFLSSNSQCPIKNTNWGSLTGLKTQCVIGIEKIYKTGVTEKLTLSNFSKR